MQIALKIDVDTCRGTSEGVPRLVALLQRHAARATFLFSVGPDRTGRALRRIFRPGFLGKVRRTSVLDHYGLKTLLYGTLLPGPDIGKRCAPMMRAVRDAGFEVGIHCWDHVRWQDGVARADAGWTSREMLLACERFRELFGTNARVHGAAGWQINIHALRLLDRLGFEYASDTRGTRPFLPVCDGERFACPQLPTTLPTFDELIGLHGITPENVAERVLGITREALPADHVFTLHAELEGGGLISSFDRLLAGWAAQGYALVSLGEYAAALGRPHLPRHEVIAGSVPGRSGTLAVQGNEVAA